MRMIILIIPILLILACMEVVYAAPFTQMFINDTECSAAYWWLNSDSVQFQDIKLSGSMSSWKVFRLNAKEAFFYGPKIAPFSGSYEITYSDNQQRFETQFAEVIWDAEFTQFAVRDAGSFNYNNGWTMNNLFSHDFSEVISPRVYLNSVSKFGIVRLLLEGENDHADH